MKENVVDLRQVVAAPVLTGRNDKYIWTGVVKSNKLGNHMFRDEKSKQYFIRLARDLEESILRYKSTIKQRKNVLEVNHQVSDPMAIETHILKVCNDIKVVLNDPEKYGIDLGLFWTELCREYEEIKEHNPDEFRGMNHEARKNLEFFARHMNAIEPEIREWYVPEKNKYVCSPFFTREQEEKLPKLALSNAQILAELLESVAGENADQESKSNTLRNMVTRITLSDLEIIFPNKKIADIQYITMFKNYLLKQGYKTDEIEKMPKEEILELALDSYNSDTGNFHSSLMADCIVSGINYIDMEKLLLLVMARPLESYELLTPVTNEGENKDIELIQKLSEKEEKTSGDLDAFNVQEVPVKEAIEESKKLENLVKKILETRLISPRTVFYMTSGNSKKEVSLARINELSSNFCDGIYMTETMQLSLLYEAYHRPNEINSWSDELAQRVGFSENDMQILSVINFDNLRRLYSLGIMSKEQVKGLLINAGNGKLKEKLNLIYGENGEGNEFLQNNLTNLLRDLYDSQILDAKDLRQYFDEVIIMPDMLNSLEEGKKEEEIALLHEDLRKEFNKEMLLKKYKEYVEAYIEFTRFQKKYPDKTDKIEDLRNKAGFLKTEKELYREVFFKYNHIPESEKHNFGEELLGTYYIEMDVSNEAVLRESVKLFYEDGLIDFENIVQMDRNYIIPMLDRLSLEDASKVRKNVTFEQLKDMLDKIFDDPDFTDERRFIAVMNLLGEDTDQDKEAREKYLGMLKFSDGERKSKSQGSRQIINRGVGKDSKKYVYPDFVKWKFYKALDKEARVTRYSNGFVEFASTKLNARIIEKYYDGDKTAYGTATYILSEEEFRENENDLVTIIPNGVILESATLKEITPRKNRIAHRTQSTDKTWMDEMIKYFDIDYERENDSRYSKAELSELKDTVMKYKTKYDEIIM